MCRRFFAIGCLLVIACIALTAVVIYTVGGPMITAGHNFMTALKNDDYSTAYTLSSTSLRSELKNADNLQEMIESNTVQPAEWAFTQGGYDNGIWYVNGTVTLIGEPTGSVAAGQRAGYVQLLFTQEDNQWKIVGFTLTPQ
jgi:hypothetical protein